MRKGKETKLKYIHLVTDFEKKKVTTKLIEKRLEYEVLLGKLSKLN